ncbi:hypothetical protein ABES58_30710 [Paenibacillus lautus]
MVRRGISQKQSQPDNPASLSLATRSLRSLKPLGFVNTTTLCAITGKY